MERRFTSRKVYNSVLKLRHSFTIDEGPKILFCFPALHSLQQNESCADHAEAGGEERIGGQAFPCAKNPHR